jgi:hypothetical protein
MNSPAILFNHAHRLAFVVDPQYPQAPKQIIETWIKTFKGAQSFDSIEKCETHRFQVILAQSSAFVAQKNHDSKKIVMHIRPVHPDLLNSVDENSYSYAEVVLDASDGQEVFNQTLELWMIDCLNTEAEQLSKKALKNYKGFEKEYKNALKEIKTNDLLFNRFKDLMASFLEIQEDFISFHNLEGLDYNLELLAKSIGKKKYYKLNHQTHNLANLSNRFYDLGKFLGSSIYLSQETVLADPISIISDMLILISMSRMVDSFEAESLEMKPGHIVQDTFQSLDIPLILLGEEGEVLQHNAAFGKLNMAPSKLTKFTDFDQIESREGVWIVKKDFFKTAKGERILYTFFQEKPQGMFGGAIAGGQDLGIITSSIAHELNNPLAGILTAMDLLMLEDSLDREILKDLKEMKQGALRCKQLVETFLGFSRLNPTIEQAPSTDHLKTCFDQALNLQRFRMVESDLRISILFSQKHPFSYPLHLPTMTMLAYLVIGEIMTAFHHLKLLERQSSRGLALSMTVFEDADQFSLEILPAINLKQDFSSKLLQFLLQQERLSLEVKESGIIHFSHQNVLL